MLLMLNGLNFGLVDTPLMAVYVFCRLALTLSMNQNFKKSLFPARCGFKGTEIEKSVWS